MKKRIGSYLMIAAGGVLTAAAFGLFILRQEFVAGGVTGLSVVLQEFIPVNLSLIILVINLLLFALGWIFAGREFILKTLIMTLLFPALLDIFSRIRVFDELSADPFLSSLLAGCMLGVGSGMILRANGSSGGFDILGVILNKKLHLPISAVMYTCDCTVILCQAVSRPLTKTVYGIVVILCCSLMINRVLMYGKSQVELLIFSSQYEEIRTELLQTFDAGMTYLNAESGYNRETTKVILTIIPYTNVHEVKKMVYSIDATAFVVINDIHSVAGKGYTLQRDA